MNLRNKIILITIVTIIALVGVGFATWTFTSKVDASVSGAEGVVTAGTWIDAISAIALTKDVESTSRNADVETLVTLPTLSYKKVPAVQAPKGGNSYINC